MEPEHYKTLIEMLCNRAELSRDTIAFTYLGQTVTFQQLWHRLNGFGHHLLGAGIRNGDRIVIALQNGPEFFYAFYGVLRAGGVAVPVYPLTSPERIIAISRLCGARKVVVSSSVSDALLEQFRKKAREADLTVLTVHEMERTSDDGIFPDIRSDHLAFLQYTSGSTGSPKGVMLTHDNLMTNIRQMIAGMEITPEDIFISWLPVFHDMGLILKTMVPFYLAAPLHLLPTDLRDVRPWLEKIQNQKGTFTAAPDFAYRLALRKTNPADHDLTSLRVALNAAEPVRESTIRAFHSAFGLENVMVAGYGLAEATVGVSMWPPGTPNGVDSKGAVSVGPPFPQVEVAIVNDDQILPIGELGEIAIKSTANSQGYFDNPKETDRLFTEDGYLLSGDLGYLDEGGNLYFVSRKKNIIKRSGTTISPWEIELVVEKNIEVRYSAAIGIDTGRVEGEQIVVFAEIRNGEQKSQQSLHELAVKIVGDIQSYMGFRPARLFLLKPKGIPLTHNGKVKHMRLREIYLNGSLKADDTILYPEV